MQRNRARSPGVLGHLVLFFGATSGAVVAADHGPEPPSAADSRPSVTSSRPSVSCETTGASRDAASSLDLWIACGDSAIPTRFVDDSSAFAPASPFEITDSQARDAVQWMVDLGLGYVPDTIDGDKDWGKTKRIYAGIKIRREGFRLTTKRRWKNLDHGRWVKYELAIARPGHPDAPKARVTTVAKLPDGRWKIEADLSAGMDYRIRVERHNLGVRWWSWSVNGKARIRLHLAAELGFQPDYSELPPAMALQPQVVEAQATLVHFDVDRISKVGGDVAEEIGEAAEKILRELWIDRENERLAGRLQREIDEKRAELRWSSADLFGGR